MASIRKEKNRHQWQHQKIHLGQHRYKEMHLCTNCGMKWDEEKFGPPANVGCPYEVRLKNLGPACEQNYVDKTHKAIGEYY